MLYTDEQIKIINSNDDFLNVIAFAGTGKTTTLKAYAEKHPKEKILYIAFNDSVIKEARNKFPSNVAVLTSHSLAYRKFGFNYKHKLKNYIKPNEVRKALLLPKSGNNIILCKKVMEGLQKFCYSSYTDISDAVYLVEDIPCSNEKYIVFLKRIWEKMSNISSEFPIIHDFYLKKFELISPKLDYDIILFDEAQDANAATQNLILKQTMYADMKILFVGDNHQEIYGFRGSKNALKNDRKQYTLTKSFRFGESIANVGNKLIKTFKEEDLKIKGNENIGSVVGQYQTNLQTAIISRTNAMVIANAIQQSEQGKRLFFIGGLEIYNFNKIMDVDNIYRENFKDVKDFTLKRFKSFKQLEEFSKIEDNSENLFLCKVVKIYSDKLRAAVKRINSLVTKNINEAEIILTTAHKAKGLEFPQVVLSNDFGKIFTKEKELKQDIKEEEINILYVALTRGIYSLLLNNDLKQLMETKDG
jgi:F-box protein 18 (helicase)